jgi:ectoine hydroxylase-related dioxygenase (phytanoyl-CoA dioxygenase family)
MIEREMLERIAREYASYGFAVAPSPFEPSETRRWSEECDRLARGLERCDPDDHRVQVRASQGGEIVRDRYDPVSDFSDLFRELATDARLTELAGAVLEAEPVLFKDRLILKAAGTHGYELHRDWPYWEWLGVPQDDFVSVMVSVDAADASNGAIEVFPGLHRSVLPPSPDEPRDLDPSGLTGRTSRIVEMGVGDVLLMHPMAPHRSGSNSSGRSRRIVTFIYASGRHRNLRERYYAEGKQHA